MIFRKYLFIFALLLSGCSSSLKNKNALIGASFSAGAIIGGASAPSDEKKEMHALYWGSILGLTAAIFSNYYWNEELSFKNLKEENERLKAEMQLMSTGPSSLLRETTAQGGKSKIRLYKVDQWINEGPNKKYHRDQVIEVIPVDQGP